MAYKQLVIHGNKSRAKTQGYTKAQDGDYTTNPGHYNGNPAFCMYLSLSKYKWNKDGSIQCTIPAGKAYLCKFPMKGSHYFGYSFKIYAGIYVGNPANFSSSSKIYSKTLLLSKPASAKTWKAGSYKTTKDITIKTSAVTSKSNIYVVIFNVSKCSCNQTNKARPVAFLSISSFIPDQPTPQDHPYIWRYRYVDISSGSKPTDWETNFGDYCTKTAVDASTYQRNVETSWTRAKSAETGIYRGEWYLTVPIHVYDYSKVTSKPSDWSTNYRDYCIRPDIDSNVYERNTLSDWNAASAQPNGIWKGQWIAAAN